MAKKTKGPDIVDRLIDVVTPKPTANVVKPDEVIVPPEKQPTVNVVPIIVAPPIIKPKSFAERIIAAQRKAAYPIDIGDNLVNIIYVEGMNPDGTKNNNDPDGFYDVRTCIRVLDSGNIDMLGVWEATTQPGWYYTRHRINSDGAAIIKLGYQACWKAGWHHGKQWALVQEGGECEVYRDDNEDAKRDGDKLQKGWFGINQHAGYDFPREKIKTASAGCLVGRTIKGHEYFMDIVCKDARYLANKQYVFGTTILEACEII